MKTQWFEFNNISDSRGSLTSIEGGRDVPFEIKRIYYLYDLNDEPRGFHAHNELQQVIVCLKGSCKIKLDDGKGKVQECIIDNPSKGLLIDAMIWHEMYEFTKNCLLMILASDHYDEADYIRDYEEFTEACNRDS